MKRLILLASVLALISGGVACSGSSASLKPTSSNSNATLTGLQKDSDIDLWVDEALRLDPRILDPDRIDIQVERGIVKLTGSADNLLEKEYATLESEKVAGVRGVINEISLTPSGRTDDEIRKDIVRRLSDRPGLKVKGLEVQVVDGSATLHGTVRSLGELKRAEAAVREVSGVLELHDRLNVSYAAPATDEYNRDQIVSALNLDPYLTGMGITVRVLDGVATLDGTVGNLYERRRAEEDVWRVASVRSVNDNLKTDWIRAHGTRDNNPSPTDDQIRQAVQDALVQDLRIEHPRSIDVAVKDGTVSLEGSVPDMYERSALEADAGDIVGVDEVTDLVQIQPGFREDASIANEIRLDLTTDYVLSGRGIKVDVQDGVATLSGTVETPYEKRRADLVARRALGVRAVVNELALPGQAAYTDAALADHVRSRLRSDWETQNVARHIKVDVDEGVATLTGEVDSWSERFEATRVAQGVNGIRKVQNELNVENS